METKPKKPDNTPHPLDWLQGVVSVSSVEEPRTQVYVIKSGDFYKIGMTQGSVASRLKGLQTGNPEPLDVIFTIVTKDPDKLERNIHEAFKHRHVRGEWYALTDTDLSDIYQACLLNWASPAFKCTCGKCICQK